MPIIAFDTHRTSNVLKREFWPELGWCKTAIKKVADTEYLIGQVVTSTGATTIATAGDVYGVVVDFQEDDFLVVLYRGPAAVRQGGLVLDSTSGVAIPAVAVALEAKNIMVLEGE